MPLRERYVWVCSNRRPDGNPKGSCAQSGSEALRDKLKVACHGAGLNGSVRVMASSCLDLCEHGIALAVMPDNTLLGHVTEGDIPALVDGLKRPGGVAGMASLKEKVLVEVVPKP
jgi:(2Fe-2S) ferredoxin